MAACRRAIVRLQAEGSIENLEDLARQSHVSRSTLSRFLRGRRVGLGTTLCILLQLRLRFDDVVHELEA
jgi:transcriptional regulator with XRE-family HTH domain